MEKQIITGNEPATGYGYANEQAHQEVTGLTIRQHFAAMAMQGILATGTANLHDQKEFISHAVNWADELLKKLEAK